MRSILRNALLGNQFVAEQVGNLVSVITRRLRRENVVVFHPGRCGSTILGILMNQHPSVQWVGEIFKGSYGDYPWVWNEPYRYIRVRKDLCVREVFGMEIKKVHFEYADITTGKVVSELKTLGFGRFVVLKRKNYLSEIVSAMVGRKMGKWNTDKKVSPPRVEIPVSGTGKGPLVEQLAEHDRFYDELEAVTAGERVLRLSYEDDIRDNPKVAYERMVDFMGINEVEVEVTTKKLNRRPIEERISNVEDVSRALSGTKYEWMIHQE